MDSEKTKRVRILKLQREAANRYMIANNPVGYAESRLPYKFWQIQKEIIEAVLRNPYVCVKSCHSSGKTFLAGTTVLLFLETYVPSKAFTTAPSNHQVEKLLWAEINTQFYKSNPAYPPHWRCLNKELKIDNDHFALGFSTDEEINFQGLHSVNFLMVADEAAGIPNSMFDAMKTLMTAANSKMLLISNPDSLSGYFYRSFEMRKFKKFTISAFETPNFLAFDIGMDDIRSGDWREKIKGKEMPFPALLSPQWVGDVYEDWGGEDSPLFVAKVFGEFPKSAIDTLIPLMYIESAQKRDIGTRGNNQWGLDVARKGNDSSVLRYRRGPRVEITKVMHKFDTTELADWAGRIIREVDDSAPVVVDAVGIGAGVADMLENHKHLRVFRYMGSAESADENCFNQRSEFYWHLRKLFVKGKISGHIDEATKEELSALDYKIPRGKVKVCKKDDIKKKIARSPDKADALMLCFAPVDSLSAIDDIIIPEVKEKVKSMNFYSTGQMGEDWFPL